MNYLRLWIFLKVTLYIRNDIISLYFLNCIAAQKWYLAVKKVDIHYCTFSIVNNLTKHFLVEAIQNKKINELKKKKPINRAHLKTSGSEV